MAYICRYCAAPTQNPFPGRCFESPTSQHEFITDAASANADGYICQYCSTPGRIPQGGRCFDSPTGRHGFIPKAVPQSSGQSWRAQLGDQANARWGWGNWGNCKKCRGPVGKPEMITIGSHEVWLDEYDWGCKGGPICPTCYATGLTDCHIRHASVPLEEPDADLKWRELRMCEVLSRGSHADVAAEEERLLRLRDDPHEQEARRKRAAERKEARQHREAEKRQRKAVAEAEAAIATAAAESGRRLERGLEDAVDVAKNVGAGLMMAGIVGIQALVLGALVWGVFALFGYPTAGLVIGCVITGGGALLGFVMPFSFGGGSFDDD